MPTRRSILPLACVLVALPVLVIGCASLARTTSTEEFTIRLLGAAPMLLGVTALLVGLLMYVLQRRIRVGATPSCRRCGYPYPETEGIVAACCECGAPWRWYGGLVKGAPVHAEGVRKCGRVLMLLALPTLLVAMTPGERAVSLVPTGVIELRLALAPSVGAGAWWDELEDRNISAVRREAIAVRLLDRRKRVGDLGGAAEDWLFNTVTMLPNTSVAARRYATEVVAPAAMPVPPPAPIRQAAAPAPRGAPAQPRTPQQTPDPILPWFDAFVAVTPASGQAEPGAGARRTLGTPTGAHHDAWLDEWTGAGGGSWSIAFAGDGGEIPPPYLPWGEINDQINARRLESARLSRSLGLPPTSRSALTAPGLGAGVRSWSAPSRFPY